MNQYAVINQSVARMGGLFFGYASICLETAKTYTTSTNQSIDLLKNLRSEAETLQEVFSELDLLIIICQFLSLSPNLLR